MGMPVYKNKIIGGTRINSLMFFELAFDNKTKHAGLVLKLITNE